MRDQIFFHLPFHPSNPNSAAIQKIWRENVASPLEKPELMDLKNHWGHKITISKLTVAYSRGPNLGTSYPVKRSKWRIEKQTTQSRVYREMSM